jgi:hypothetical protein
VEELITDAPQAAINDFVMAKNMADTLHKHYPKHIWAVTCEGDRGIATIRNLSLSGDWGFILHLDAQYSASHWDRKVINAGGEILERFRVARTVANFDQLAALPTDIAGRHKADK